MSQAAPIDLATFNTLPQAALITHLDGLYEHSPWVVERTIAQRPFASFAAFKYALAQTVRAASREEQLSLLCAHPELASKAAVAGELTADSRGEQSRAGLLHCSPEEFARLRELNTRYRERFGFPFIIAVRGPTGAGLTRHEIMAALARRVLRQPEVELTEALRQVDRIAEIRLADRVLTDAPTTLQGVGQDVMQWAQDLAAHTEQAPALTCTYLTAAHHATREHLAQLMRTSGFDQVWTDAVGNVIGRYSAAAVRPSETDAAATLDRSTLPPSQQAAVPLVVTGSHYDTVRNGGRYDGRLGILLPMALVARWKEQGWRPHFDLDVIGFAEEEGVRYGSTFLGSAAWLGVFDPAWLDLTDAQGIPMHQALRDAGLDPARVHEAAARAEDRARLRAFLEVHIEQGPVLLERNLPLGVVTSIAGSVRRRVMLYGTASHAGTTPMTMRADAACAAAEIVLAVEQRCNGIAGLVGTVGQLQVPNGSVNVIAGRCEFSLDIRAETDAVRDAAVADIDAAIAAICARRQVAFEVTPLLEAPAAPCAMELQARWAQSIEALGLPVHHLPSGAGHDAMIMARHVPTAMLFTRCGNGGISHNPLETMTADDAQLAAQVLDQVLREL